MGNPKFNIGDKVKTHSERGRGVNGVAYVSSMDAYSGVIARVKDITETNDNGVEKWFYRLENTPFHWHESLLEAVNNESKVVITTDGTTTRAALYDGHKLIREAKAMCSKEDVFDFETGAKIAFERLTAKPAEPKPKKVLKLLNTKIFVIDGQGDFESGHIYEIKDGKIIDDEGWRYPFEGSLYNMNDVHKYFNGESDVKYNAVGDILGNYTTHRQVKVMEVKEG
jgi:hypothetical protein